MYGTSRRRFNTPSPEGGETPSPFRVDQPPGHGTDLIEEVEGGVGSDSVDGARLGEEPKVSVNLFRRGVGDSIMVRSISAGPSMAFGEVGRNRACRSNDLIADALEGRWHSGHQCD